MGWGCATTSDGHLSWWYLLVPGAVASTCSGMTTAHRAGAGGGGGRFESLEALQKSLDVVAAP